MFIWERCLFVNCKKIYKKLNSFIDYTLFTFSDNKQKKKKKKEEDIFKSQSSRLFYIFKFHNANKLYLSEFFIRQKHLL